MKGQERAGRGIPASRGESAVGGTPNDRLDSWKDIAEYLKRDVRTVVLHVKDIPHDFTVKELDIHIHGGPGDTVKQTMTFAKPGTYEFYCSIAGHKQAGMKGELVVQ